MTQWASSSSLTRTSVRRLPSNARVSCSARPMTSCASRTDSGFTLSSSITVIGIAANLTQGGHALVERTRFPLFGRLLYGSVSTILLANRRSVEDRSMQKALAPDISTWPDDSPQLIGSRCGDCGATTFPVQQRCPRCSGGEMSELLLPRSGTLVTWTTQGFPPGAPYAGPAGDDFVPFGVGLVQLGDVIRVEGRLTENDPAKLKFGQPVELTMVPFTTDADGNEIVTFAFQPV